MRVTAPMAKLLRDAAAAGFTVKHEARRVLVARYNGRRLVLGLEIWPDGTATRADVAAELCATIRAQKQMRNVLGLA